MQMIHGVEIFSVGTWNGDHYSELDLDQMVKAFQETSKTLRPPLKLGHDDRQIILQQDGLPAAGWIGNLYRQGEKLLADLIEIPGKVFDLLQRGSYKKVSSEIYWDIELNGKKYPKLLGAVALLGADMPAVSNLKDIMAMFALNPEQIKSYQLDETSLIIKTYQKKHEGEGMKTEAELKLELELEAQKKKTQELEGHIAQFQADAKAKDKESADLKQFKSEAEANAIEAAKKLSQAQLEKEIAELEKEKLISPSMKPYIEALLGSEKKEYSFKINEKEEKFSKAGLLKAALKLFAENASVNFEEGSEALKVESDKQSALDTKIQKYAKDHNISYSAAYKAVLKDSVQRLANP